MPHVIVLAFFHLLCVCSQGFPNSLKTYSTWLPLGKQHTVFNFSVQRSAFPLYIANVITQHTHTQTQTHTHTHTDTHMHAHAKLVNSLLRLPHCFPIAAQKQATMPLFFLS